MTDEELFRGWVRSEWLGKGGNGQVWKATKGGVVGALKILNDQRVQSERFRRFVDEVTAIRLLENEPGVVPILDSFLPDNPSKRNPAWLVMPVATPIHVALGERPQIEIVVDAVATIAETLSRLAERQICHRDIKPSNLYRLDNRWVISDFGLADFPDKADITEAGRAIGPRFYIAPEMIREPRTASGFPADVWSLVKTLWVLATGQNYPPEGPLSAADRNESLITWVDHPRVYLLDRLIENGTRKEPADRPTMGQVASDLRAWLTLADQPIHINEVSDIVHHLALAGQPFYSTLNQLKACQKEAERLSERLLKELEPLGKSLEHAGLQYTPPNKGSSGLLDNAGFEPSLHGDYGVSVSLHTPGPITHVFQSGFIVQVLDAGRHRIYATHRIRPHRQSSTVCHAMTVEVESGSIQEEQQVRVAIGGLYGTLRGCLGDFCRFIAEHPPSPPRS